MMDGWIEIVFCKARCKQNAVKANIEHLYKYPILYVQIFVGSPIL